MNQEIYLNEFIKKKTIPFIEKHHSNGKYIFWPDLTTSHYAKTVVDYMDENVNFMKKEDNPANLPKICLIEDFWGILKGKVYMHNYQAKNLNQLHNRIMLCF